VSTAKYSPITYRLARLAERPVPDYREGLKQVRYLLGYDATRNRVLKEISRYLEPLHSPTQGLRGDVGIPAGHAGVPVARSTISPDPWVV
jgi:hypothetical protein